MGSGFRTFTAGEVLTASNVQNYLMDQSVMTFADSAARSSAIGTANFEEGMTSYLQDTKLVEVYNGTAWVGVAPAAVTPGLVQIGTAISFSGVASQAIPANTFSATYDNYKFILNCTQSDTVALFLRMRTGSTNTATGYAQAGWSYKADGATAVFANNANRNEMALGDGDTAEQMYVGEIQKPFLTSNTGIHHQGMASYQNKGVINSCILKNSTSYDAILIYPGSGTITGTIRMYGYNQ